MDAPLKKREDIKRLPGGGGFGKWTTIMKPMDKDWVASKDSGSAEAFIPRKGDGLRLKNNRFPTTEGVYEIRVVPPGGDEKSDSVVIYLGKAGGEGTKSSLDQRMSQYMYDGSHKADLYNALLKGGCTIQARVMKTGEYSTRGRSAKQRAKDVETKFLAQADYAANKMENGKLRLDSTYINANGKKVSIEQFAKKNGYVPKHSSTDKGVRAGKEARPGGKPASGKGKNTPTSSSSSQNGVKLKKDGTPDMRYKANKEKDLGLQKTNEKPSAADVRVARLKKDGTPDMRFKANKKIVESVLSKKEAKSTLDARSLGKARTISTSGPLKKDGTPDMRYKANKETSSPSVSSSYTSRSSSSSSSSSRRSSGPTKRDGTPDMRYKVNRQSRNLYSDGWGFSTGYSGFSGGYGGGFGGGGGFSTPMTKSGRPDMRYSINKSLYG